MPFESKKEKQSISLYKKKKKKKNLNKGKRSVYLKYHPHIFISLLAHFQRYYEEHEHESLKHGHWRFLQKPDRKCMYFILLGRFIQDQLKVCTTLIVSVTNSENQ